MKVNEKSFEKGDILVSIWGYGETNVDFFKVLRTTGKSVYIQAINSVNCDEDGKEKEPDGMGGLCKPDIGSPNPRCCFMTKASDKPVFEKIKRIKFDSDGEPYIKLSSFAIAEKWDGNPVRESWYY